MATKFGTASNDTLTGTGSADIIYGGPTTSPLNTGDDIINAAAGADILFGGDGNDTLNGEQGNDTLVGGAGADRLDGGANTNTVDYSQDGGTGAATVNLITGTAIDSFGNTDTLIAITNIVGTAQGDSFVANVADGANNTLAGGGGQDTIDYSAATNGVTVNLATGKATGTGLGTDTLTSIENVATGSGSDTIVGNVTDGLNNTFNGDGGTDTIDYSASTNALIVDLVSGSANGVGIGTDTLLSIEAVKTGSGNDVVTGTAGNQSIATGAGNDTIIGFAGSDTVDGGTGTGDTIVLTATSTDLNTAADVNIKGIEAVSAATAGLGVAINLGGQAEGFAVTGSGSGDIITGGAGADGIVAGVGDDTIVGFAGADTVDGGAGTSDTIVLSATAASLNGAADARIAGVEIVSAAAAAAGVTINLSNQSEGFLVVGGGFADKITGGAGADTISAGEDNDTVTAGVGADTIDITGGGNDVVSGGNDADVIIAGATFAASDQIDGGAGTDILQLNGDYAAGVVFGAATLTNVEQITVAAGNSYKLTTNNATVAAGSGLTVDGSALSSVNTLSVDGSAETNGNFALVGGGGADTLVGGSGVDAIYGLVGNDFLVGGGGTDIIDGGDGSDTIVGGAGADTLTGGLGADTFVISAVADLAAGETIDATGEIATLDMLRLDAAGTYNLVNVTTISHIDQISLNQNAAGFNLMIGGGQVNTADANGDNLGGDLLISSATAMTIGATINASALSGALQITVDGTNLGGNDTITGGGGKDVLAGGAGADVINGGAGSDTITGGAGADSLTGGAGADTFVISAVANLVAGEVLNGTAEAGTLDTLRLDAAGSYNLSSFTTISNIDQITLNQNASGFTLTVANSQAASADANGDGVGGDLLINAGAAMASGVAILAGGLTGSNRITVDGSNLGGSDLITGGAGADSLAGGAGNDEILGNGGNDIYDGGAGNDLLEDVIGGNDTIVGGDGNDSFSGGGGADVLIGGNGSDVFYLTTLSDFLAGESIEGTAEAGTLDSLWLQTASNYDFSAVSTISDIDSMKLNYVDATGFGLTVANSQVSSADANGDGIGGDLAISATHALSNGVTIIGSGLTGSNRITVDGTFLGGNDTIAGGAGNDTLSGGAGADSLSGGDGDDTFNVIFSDVVSSETIDGGSGIDTILITDGSGHSGNPLGQGVVLAAASLSNIDRLEFATTASPNFFHQVILDGSQIGSGLSSTLAVQGDANGDIIIVNVGADQAASLAGWTFSGFGANAGASDQLYLIGSGGAETLVGSSYNDIIGGNNGDDVITGGGAADSMSGGFGADVFVIGAVGDLAAGEAIDGVAEAATQDTLRLDAAGTYDLSAFTTITNIDRISFNQNAVGFDLTVADSQVSKADADGNGTLGDMAIGAGVALTAGVTIDASGLTGSNRIAIDGSNLGGNDTVSGGAGNDTIAGGGGDDVLAGGGGADVLQGGVGNDRIALGPEAPAEVDGGGDVDTVGLDAAGASIDLSGTLSAAIHNIEKIDLSGSHGNTLMLDQQAVLAMAGGDGGAFAANTLLIKGDIGDGVSLTDGWNAGATVSDPYGEVGSYVTYTNGTATLLVESDVQVYTGSIDAETMAPAVGFRVFGADSGDSAGWSVAAAGDINGDGFDDLLIGAPFADGPANGRSNAGETYVVFGGPAGFGDITLASLAPSQGFRIFGADGGDGSGYDVAPAGDINGDGFVDLIIGAPYGDGVGDSKGGAGEAIVVFGSASGFADIDAATMTAAEGFRIFGAAAGDRTGQSVSSAGDVNGDGLDDLIVGASLANGAGGEAFVIFGKSAGLADIDLSAITPADGFRIFGGGSFTGNTVASAGDINGDGFDDLLVSSVLSNTAAVVFGKASGFGDVDLSTMTPAAGFRIFGADGGDYAGQSVFSAGDINGDGFDDLIIAARGGDGADNTIPTAGEAIVLFGKDTGFADINVATMTAADGFRIFGAMPSEQFGWSVSTAGDVNGDGYDDLIVGGISGSGEAVVLFGKASGFADVDLSSLTPDQGLRIVGADGGDLAGWSVSSAGDINGDGFDDLMVGAIFAGGAGNTSSNAGEAIVVYGGNFLGGVTFAGTSGADALTGTSAAEVFVGGLGDDTLTGGGGADAFGGGAGNDVIALAAPLFADIEGGNGIDTIRLDGAGQTLDLTAIRPAEIQGIEQIDITGSGNNTLTLSVADVLDLSDDSNQVVVSGNVGDIVHQGGGWTAGAVVNIGGQDYQTYTAGQATLLVDTDVTTAV